MCDINANGPPVGPSLHHRAVAQETRELGGLWGGVDVARREVGGGKVQVTTGERGGGGGEKK